MPLSRRRKNKKGKKVGNGTRIVVDPNALSHVTLQDLINALAYQESLKDDDDPTKMVRPDDVIASDVEIHMADQIPVNIINADGTKTQVGLAQRDPENPDKVSIDIEDPEMVKMLEIPAGHIRVSTPEGVEDER